MADNIKNETRSDLQNEIQKIENGYVFKTQLIEAISRKDSVPDDSKEIVEIIHKYSEPEIYRELLFCITNHLFDVNEASELWDKIIKHREELKGKLGREPGIKVSALDFLENIAGRLKNLKLIESNKIQFIAQSSLKDMLTNLYNKKTFESRLELEIRRSKRYNRKMSLLLFDIDHFKNINDTYGHQVGDMILAHIGRLVLENIRESDSAFRFGGEEFAIILVESNKKDSMRYSQRLRNLIEKTDFEGFTITISVGCSEFKNKTDSPKSLVKRVDMALYKAKKRGRNGVCAL